MSKAGGSWRKILPGAAGPAVSRNKNREGGIMDSVIVEIRAAEGGDDSKLLVEDQFVIYGRLAARHGL